MAIASKETGFLPETGFLDISQRNRVSRYLSKKPGFSSKT
ncbi:hypothetical protein SPLC1_S033190 [Arthrospira platensis C1]|nr:hypothetical protein SPLC1_S033190 [Arthrospira platensis C1]